MRAFVDEEICILCEMCVELCPEVFRACDGKIEAIEGNIGKDKRKDVQKAQKGCPVDAITTL